jgi:hypothetical protein
MKNVLRFVLSGSIFLILPGLLLAGEVELIVKGTVWDSDSRGFAWYQRLSKNQGTIKAARRGARISLDGRPEVFAVSGKGGSFELSFTTSEPTFRLIVEGDRFPRTITQPYDVPAEDGVFDIDRINTPRAEGAEHTWPLPMMANALGYATTQEMLADNKAAIRIGFYGSGAEGAPDWTERAKLSFEDSTAGTVATESTSSSPFLMRIPRSEYVVPFDMTPQDTYFMNMEEATGFYIIIVSFEPGDGMDKDIVLNIEDTIVDELLDPPRPWKFSPLTKWIRNGVKILPRYRSVVQIELKIHPACFGHVFECPSRVVYRR